MRQHFVKIYPDALVYVQSDSKHYGPVNGMRQQFVKIYPDALVYVQSDSEHYLIQYVTLTGVPLACLYRK